METTKLKMLLSQWNSIEDFQNLALHYYNVSEGDARKLSGTHDSKKTIFGILAKQVFKDNSELHRYLLWLIWNENKGDVKKHFSAIALSLGKRKNIAIKVPNTEERKNTFCWCELTKGSAPWIPHIKCTQCNENFHVLCSGLTEEEANNLTEFRCIICSGTPTVPLLFRNPFRNKADERQVNLSTPLTLTGTPTQKEKAKASRMAKAKKRLTDIFGLKRESTPKQKCHNANISEESDDDFKENGGSPTKNGRQANDTASCQPSSQLTPPSQLTPQKSPSQSLLKTPDYRSFKSVFADNPKLNAQQEQTGCDVREQKYQTKGVNSPIPVGNIKQEENKQFKVWTSPISVENIKQEQVIRFKGYEHTSPFDVNQGKGKTTKCEPGNDNDEIKVRLDTSEVPDTFILSFSREECKQLFPKDETSRLYSVNADYGDIIQAKFRLKNAFCVLAFDKKTISNNTDSAAAFFKAYGHCNGPNCRANYILNMKKFPSKLSTSESMTVSRRGEVVHHEGECNMRFLKGSNRKLVKAKLENELPSNVYREGLAQATVAEMQRGNYDVVKTLRRFQQAKVEVLQDKDAHADVLVDLLMTKIAFELQYQSPKLNGFIHNIGLFPFTVVMYTEESMQLLRKMTNQGKKLCVFFDSTATLCNALPDPLDTGRLFYYCLCIDHPKEGRGPVPILEFHTSQQDVATVMGCLESFFYRYKCRYQISDFNFNIPRFEIDYSKVLLTSTIRVLEGVGLDEYFRRLWRLTALDECFSMVCIHVCRIHAVKFLKAKMDEIYPSSRFGPEFQAFLKTWRHRFLSCKFMNQLDFLAEVMIRLCGCKKRDAMLHSILETRDLSNIPAVDERRWKEFDTRTDASEPWYLRSPFGRYFVHRADTICQANNQSLEKQENPFYSETLLTYFLEHVFSYGPILTKIPFLLFDIAITKDTTNTVEYWMKITKKDVLHSETYDKLGRVIRAQAPTSIGLVKEALATFPPPVVRCQTPKDGLLQTPGRTGGKDLPNFRHPFDIPVRSHHNEAKNFQDVFNRSGQGESQGSGNIGRLSVIQEENPNVLKSSSYSSPEKAREVFKTLRNNGRERSGGHIQDMALLEWGGQIDDCNITDTCNFDCSVQALYYLYTYTESGRSFIGKWFTKTYKENKVGQSVQRVLQCMDKRGFSQAKKIWICDILGLEIKGKEMSFLEEERVNGLMPLVGWFQVKEILNCQSPKCADLELFRIRETSSFVSETQADISRQLNHGRQDHCWNCHQPRAYYTYDAAEDHDYGIFALIFNPIYKKYVKGKVVNLEVRFKEQDLQTEMAILGMKFRVLCYTLFSGSHYKLVIIFGGRRFVYDGLRADRLQPWDRNDDSFGVSIVWLEKLK